MTFTKDERRARYERKKKNKQKRAKGTYRFNYGDNEETIREKPSRQAADYIERLAYHQ